MNQKLAWFLLGALFASMFWVIVVIGLNEQLLQPSMDLLVIDDSTSASGTELTISAASQNVCFQD
jgi:hypothetical protein